MKQNIVTKLVSQQRHRVTFSINVHLADLQNPKIAFLAHRMGDLGQYKRFI